MKLKWTTERRKLSELTRYERNPRLVTDKGKQELNDSVNEFGYAVPLTINTDGTIIGGHQRYEKALADGETEIECTVPERVLTAGEVKRLNVRLNKNIAGTFDYDLLKEDYDLNELYDLGFGEDDFSETDIEDTKYGKEKLAEEYETFLKNDIKQIILYYSGSDYERILKSLERVQLENKMDNNSDVIIFLLSLYADQKNRL